MNLTNKQIRKKARYLLDENIFGKDWLKSVLVTAIMFSIDVAFALLLSSVVTMVIGLPLALLQEWLLPNSVVMPVIINVAPQIVIELITFGISGVFAYGLASVHYDLVQNGQHLSVRKFFDGFKSFVDNFLLGFMHGLHVTLWTLLFIAPGIYVSYSYALIYHVKKDHPDYRWQQCFDESERLMEGNRWRLFKLQFSLIGWAIVGTVAACFGGPIWVFPYLNTVNAVFYDEVKKEKDTNIVSFDPKNQKTPDPVVITPNNLGISLHKEK